MKNDEISMRIELLLKEAALKYTDLPAFSEWTGSSWESFNYHELLEKAAHFATMLQARELKPGERVVMIAHNQTLAVVALIGIWMARGTAVLIDPDLPIAPLLDQVSIADSRIIIIEHERCEELIVLLHTEYCVLMHQGIFEWQKKNNGLSKTIDEDCSEDIATLLFTSGTTGEHKAVMLTHQNYLYLNTCYKQYAAPFEKKCVITVLPLFHVAGLFTSILQPLFVGGHIVFFRLFSVEALQEAFLKYRPDMLITVPRLLEVFDQKVHSLVRERGLLSAMAFSCMLKIAYFLHRFCHWNIGLYLFKSLHEKFGGKLIKIFTGSAALSPAVQKHFLTYGFELIFSYGLTETCGPITVSPFSSRFIPGNVGVCVNQNDLSITDSGEIIYRGPALMKGYFRDPETTEKAIQAGYFHTRDLGTVDLHHRLKIIGRLKELIVFSDGKKAMPEQIEKQYSGIENIKEFAIFGVNENDTTLAVFAFVPNEKSNTREITQKIFQVSSHLKSPYRISDVLIVDKLPRSSTIKIKRHELTERYLQKKQADRKSTSVAEFDYAVSEIVACFREVLSEKKNSITKDITFAELGIDSFCAVQLTNELNKRFNLTLSPTVFWFVHNIAELHTYISENAIGEKTQMKSQPKNKSGKIAIIAMDCRFPDAPDFDTYWQHMMEGRDAIIEIPTSRWENKDYYDAYALAPGKTNSRHGGFIDLCDRFPGDQFGLKQRIVESMDPQQKILLMMTQKLLRDFPLTDKEKKKTGFYLGAGFPEFMIRLTRQFPPEKISPYSGIGMADFSSIARVSYHFGLEGPALLIKTACSSSLVAVHQAVRALQAGDCELAIAGGINLVMSPDISVSLTKGGFLSPDGRCKAFDAAANGYVRSEGAGLLLLKNYDDAIRDNNTILGVILGSAVNQDGASNGITAPNGHAQANCYQMALANAGIAAEDIHYIEAHGSGTQLGDAIEMQSIQWVYDKKRALDNPIYVGAVKSAIGHCEAAAGIAGFIKTLGVLRYQKIPPNLHYHTPNPNIVFENSAVYLPKEAMSFKKSCEFAAVSSFGVAGTNAHMILSRC